MTDVTGVAIPSFFEQLRTKIGAFTPIRGIATTVCALSRNDRELFNSLGKKPLGLVSCHLQVQVPVLPGGIFPGYVLVHVPLDHFVPAVAVGEVEGLGPVDGVQQEAWAFARAVLSVEYNMW